jgi:hypothetical protein
MPNIAAFLRSGVAAARVRPARPKHPMPQEARIARFSLRVIGSFTTSASVFAYVTWDRSGAALRGMLGKILDRGLE